MNKKEQAVIEILRSTGVDVLEVAILARKALKVGHGKVKRTFRCLVEGEKH